jgi:hypothetical protein
MARGNRQRLPTPVSSLSFVLKIGSAYQPVVALNLQQLDADVGEDHGQVLHQQLLVLDDEPRDAPVKLPRMRLCLRLPGCAPGKRPIRYTFGSQSGEYYSRSISEM